mmetsp:Transcript_62240/g.145933  ORF Transcript_62240/g.145933 Transcript_62240/m.145933 type:complete len:215 (+) Transcript_62240:1279-1923(+)
MSTQTLEAEPGKRLIAVLVSPLLVDWWVHSFQLIHGKLYRIVALLKMVKLVFHEPEMEAAFDEVLVPVRPDVLPEKLIGITKGHLDVQGIVNVHFRQLFLRSHGSHWHELLGCVRHWRSHMNCNVRQVDHLLIEVGLPIRRCTSPRVRVHVEAGHWQEQDQGREDTAHTHHHDRQHAKNEEEDSGHRKVQHARTHEVLVVVLMIRLCHGPACRD